MIRRTLKWLFSRVWDLIPSFGSIPYVGGDIDRVVCRVAEFFPAGWYDQNDVVPGLPFGPTVATPIDWGLMEFLLATCPDSVVHKEDVKTAHDEVLEWSGHPWVRFLAREERTWVSFARYLSLVRPVDTWVAYAVWCRCRFRVVPALVHA